MTSFSPERPRTAHVERATSETDITLNLNLDGTGIHEIDTGVAFLDHMLSNFSRHARIDLTLSCKGDIEVDDHHSAEDTAIVLGNGLKQALGSKEGIERYGWSLIPMDETLARCALDLGGRSYCAFRAEFSRPSVNGFATEMVEHFFLSLAHSLQANIHLAVLDGTNTHHKIEALFKAFAYALRQAVSITGSGIASTKGVM
ncbi:imidazoleglycerol-phosphate dehydratase HisB [Prosthecochloris sp. N3]|uniref:Imidazoleglycerol-phosphate dehydratase n=1 Tax=Prosthecochloris ethylica TaxID=2743976 RepID=A0ABR9XSW8_9CHLB|nr:imidazoleglycerol-phosphate dehydratase HisB [Prosthecochloris ethylica]MBF0586627.1 imidazoleglycerol-phosphate dehydratase HisB [Prosthecochloris ethylica]MBF0637019.1 imidazoleglycerol-phosphate dehydratase HisB [Prosthecochloris ethylica]NUK47890.1 imidazoleglycerol-phosphate dehydratase HisB [Prosthecochloris ethylica]